MAPLIHRDIDEWVSVTDEKATLQYEIMPHGMQNVANVLPLTQGIKILKNATLGLPIENVTGAVVFIVVLAILCSVIAIKGFHWE